MTNAITTRHATLARAIKGLRRSQAVGECLIGILILLLCTLQWVATEPHQHFGIGFITVIMFCLGVALRHQNRIDYARYKQRCNRMMLGFERGYHDALACTRLHRSTDTDHMLGYEDGYVAGVDERNLRIKQAVKDTKQELCIEALTGHQDYV